MAARQDQTLQIALIVFAILLVVFAGFTYWFYKQSSDAQQRITALESEMRETQTQYRNFQADNDELLGLLGFPPQTALESVQQEAEADMARMGATLPEEKRNYREVLEVIYAENQQLAIDQGVDKERINDLEVKLREIEAGHQAQIARLQADKAKIEQEAAAARNQFQQARAELDATKQELAQKLAAQTEAFTQERTQLVAAREAAEAESEERQETIDRFLEERAVEDFSFEVSDGRITWVNQANNTVWINIGSADALRRQVNFSVYDSDESDAGKAEKKGSIEVVELLGPHMAECRVTDDDPRNPILRGDYIYSPAWHRGRPQHFALTGLIDLNDDGQSDLQLAKDVIQLNGGVVDAAPNPETGEQEGEMTIDTRYLVYGEFPERSNQGALRQTWDNMHKRADALGVELISVDDFLNQMGYKPEDRTVGLGSNTQASDFRPRQPSGDGNLRPRAPYGSP